MGDRVCSLVDDFPGLTEGELGTVVGFGYWGDPVVEWDEYNSQRHDADGMTKSGHGWFINKSEICFADPEDFGDLPEFDGSDVSKFLFDL